MDRPMTIKLTLSTYLCCFIFLSSCTLFCCVDTVSTTFKPSAVDDHTTHALPQRATDAHVYRQLRTHTEPIVVEDSRGAEERIAVPRWLAFIWEKIMSLWPVRKLAPHLYLKFASDKTAAIKRLFDSYEVKKDAGLQLFTSPAFIKWSSVVLGAYKHDAGTGYQYIFERLLDLYDRNDIEFGRLLMQAELLPETERIHFQTTSRLMWYWKSMQPPMSAKHLFEKLGLNRAAINLQSPDVALYNFYVAFILGSEDAAHKNLMKIMKGQKDLDMQIIEACAKGGRVSDLGWGLQLQRWKKLKVTPEKLWNLMEIDKSTTHGVVGPNENARRWAAYAWINGKVPTSMSEYFHRIKSKISRDDLAKMLALYPNRNSVDRILGRVYRLAVAEKKQEWVDFVTKVVELREGKTL